MFLKNRISLYFFALFVLSSFTSVKVHYQCFFFLCSYFTFVFVSVITVPGGQNSQAPEESNNQSRTCRCHRSRVQRCYFGVPNSWGKCVCKWKTRNIGTYPLGCAVETHDVPTLSPLLTIKQLFPLFFYTPPQLLLNGILLLTALICFCNL